MSCLFYGGVRFSSADLKEKENLAQIDGSIPPTPGATGSTAEKLCCHAPPTILPTYDFIHRLKS